MASGIKQFYITGTSSGIGYALAKACLSQGHYVVGISRRKKIDHPSYQHLSYDLANYENYHLINFDRIRTVDQVVLVNNAGWIGDVKPIGKINPSDIQRSYEVNLITPSILTRLFIDQTQKYEAQRAIINISSGAARSPVPSWSSYCAAKAGLEMLSQVVALDHPDIRIHSISPGVVDTEMQGELRAISQEDFPDLNRFVELKEHGQLSKPEEIAAKILHLLSNPDKAHDIVTSLRDYQL